MRDITPDPPHDGEVVLFCTHQSVSDTHIRLTAKSHWYCFQDTDGTPGTEVRNERTGEIMIIRWLCICDLCQKAGVNWDDGAKEFVGFDAPWIGDPPDIDHGAN